MNILKNLFLLNKKSEKTEDFSSGFSDQYIEIAKLVKEARIQQNLTIKEKKILKKEGKDFLFKKFDLINTWQGSLLYFFILVLTIFILKRYFILNVNVIEIQNIENQMVDK